MKKLLSMVLAAAMVVSLVPATAFAKGDVTATAKVVDAVDLTKDEAKTAIEKQGAPEIQLKIRDVDYQRTDNDPQPSVEVTFTLDKAKFYNEEDVASEDAAKALVEKLVGVRREGAPADNITIEITEVDEDEFTAKFKGAFEEDDIIYVDLATKLTKTSNGTKATVSVDSKMVNADDLVFATVVEKGIKASIKKTVDVAEEEKVELNSKGLKIEPAVGDVMGDVYESGDVLKLKLSKGFEFVKGEVTVEYGGLDSSWTGTPDFDGNTVEFELSGRDLTAEDLTIKGLEVEATTAKAGAVCTMTVSVNGLDSVKLEVAKVVDYKVSLSVDEDEDIPVIYSGVNVNNDGITDDSDHLSLEVTAEETFPGAWSFRKGFNFELPAGVYVTNVEVTDTDGILKTAKENDAIDAAGNVDTEKVEEAFYNAYQDGDHVNFEFEKRVFDDVDAVLNDDCASMTFQLELVADPTFEGDVVLKLTGDLVDEQEVTIAKFVKPYTVKAEQNDLKIDYRYTEIPTEVVITEAEGGLWDKGATFTFTVDDNDSDLILFEDGLFVVDEDSELELKKDDDVNKNGAKFEVKSISEEAATVTLKDMSLFMQRNIPAGPYDLKITSSLAKDYEAQPIFAADEGTFANDACTGTHDDDKECFVGDVCDYSKKVKEGFVNIITAGREVDDASFTTKVVVPVGEAYLIAGEKQVALDVPAYINAAGYTMLPVRAVATALGINNSNVLWDGPTKTVTILYGQRIITMVAGQKVVYVNGSAIPASASVEIVNGRTFLPMRDLATALGVTDITWDAATKTATLNGSQK